MFKSKHYPTFIYLGIIILTLILTFNFMNIMENSSSKLTAHMISEYSKGMTISDYEKIQAEKNNTVSNENNRTTSPYYFYNGFILVTFLLIVILLIRFIYKIQIPNIT